MAKTTKIRNLEEADRLVAKTLEIIAYFRPKRWWVENPRWGLLNIRRIPFLDVDFGSFRVGGIQSPAEFGVVSK